MKTNSYNRLIVIAIMVIAACVMPLSLSSAEIRDDHLNNHIYDSIFQVSVIRATVEGLYDGVMTFGELKKHGDFGIGTFEGLDGELVALDGNFYQLKADGTARLASDSMKTPLATITFFDADENLSIEDGANLTRLQSDLDTQMPTKNIFYAFRIDGTFDYIKTRAVPAQEKPYPPLADAVKEQNTLEFKNLKGTIVGFRFPDFAQGIGLPGYHMHFINSDHSAGGHLLDCRVRNASVKVDEVSSFEMVMPEDEAFYEADLSDEKQDELKQAESNPASTANDDTKNNSYR